MKNCNRSPFGWQRLLFMIFVVLEMAYFFVLQDGLSQITNQSWLFYIKGMAPSADYETEFCFMEQIRHGKDFINLLEQVELFIIKTICISFLCKIGCFSTIIEVLLSALLSPFHFRSKGDWFNDPAIYINVLVFWNLTW